MSQHDVCSPKHHYSAQWPKLRSAGDQLRGRRGALAWKCAGSRDHDTSRRLVRCRRLPAARPVAPGGPEAVFHAALRDMLSEVGLAREEFRRAARRTSARRAPIDACARHSCGGLAYPRG